MKEIKLCLSDDEIRRLLMSVYFICDEESNYIVSDSIVDALDKLIFALESALYEEKYN